MTRSFPMCRAGHAPVAALCAASIWTLAAPLTATSAMAEPLAGSWASEGYGFWLSIDQGAGQETGQSTGQTQVSFDQVTAAGCVKMADVTALAGDGDARLLEGIQLAGIGGMMGQFDAPLQVVDDQLHLHLGKVNPVVFSRATLPDSCADRQGPDALSVFDTFWHAFDEHYAYFDLRDVDWQAVRDQYRPTLTAKTGGQDLFATLEEIVTPFGDGHVSILSMIGQVEADTIPPWAAGKDPETLVDYMRQAFDAKVSEGTRPHDTLGYGITADGIGYMTLIGFDDALVEGEVTMQSILADLMAKAPDMQALVIDVRVNFGGDDTAGYALAQQLTTTDVAIGSKAIWEDGQWYDDIPLTIEAGENDLWTGPTYLLTSGMTISAAETFALALSQFDNVTLVGAPSNGILSDKAFFALPNGWMVTLSNERYLDALGQNFEGRGVPVDIAAPFVPDDIVAGKDRAYDAVLADLARN